MIKYGLAALFIAMAAPAQADQTARGKELYAANCAECHGADGRGGTGYAYPIWGPQTQIQKYQTAQGLFEYMQYLMPFDDPTKVTDEQKWDIVAYMLANHGAAVGQTVGPANGREVPIK
ncbi:MAG: c-type cytochrome [Hyphomicrobiales bacterium]|nr:c-type cytochrome [Hyphomicrobiales bacterium]